MNSITSNIVKAAIHSKKYDMISELAKIEYPDKSELIVTEYAGSGVRLYKDTKNRVRLLCPKDIDVYQENHVTEAIANGTIFDDADDVDNNADMIEKTTIPYNAMINSGKCTPKKLKPMIAIVISKMDDDGSFDVSDIDRDNGNRFVKAIVCCKDKGTDIPTVVGDYIEKDKEKFYTPEMGRDIVDLEKETEDIRNTKNEDVITDDDTVEDYFGEIPQSGDFDGYGDDVDLDDHDKDPDDDEEESDENEEEISNDDSDDNNDDDDDEEEDSDDDDNDDDNDDVEEDDDEDEDDDDVVEESYEGYYDEDGIYQESVFQTLKKIGFDPKTNTILTNIDDPNGKKGQKYRCKVKIGDAASKKRGICLSYTEHGKDDCIHIPLELLRGDAETLIARLKHEEGHIYISLDKERFAKDFKNAEQIVSRLGDKLSDHGNVPEEYVADLYSARQTGDNGAAIIRDLKSLADKRNEKARKLKAKFSKEAVDKELNIVRKFVKPKEGKPSKLDQTIFKGINKLLDSILYDSDKFVDDLCEQYHVKKAGAGEYSKSQNTDSKNQAIAAFEDVKKSTNSLKSILGDIKTVIGLIKKVISGDLDIERFEKTCYDTSKKFCERVDECVKAGNFETKIRIAFIKKYVNESYTYEFTDDNQEIYNEHSSYDYGDNNEDLDEDDDIKEIEEFFSNLIIEDVYQESKSTHYQRTMKKFDYDPKTQTVKTDIDMPDGKKLRAKLTIDDEFSQAIGPCVTYLVRRNPDGSIMYPDDPDKIVDKTKYEIHMRRRDLKQKGYRVAFALKHEEGHIANGHVEQLNGVDPIASIIPTAKDGKYKDDEAKSFLDGKDLSSVSEHDANPIEYTADKYAAEHTSKRTADKALKNLYKNCQNLLLEQSGLYEDYVNAKKNIKMCKKKMKNLTEQDKKNIQKSIASLSKKISHLISEIQSVDMKIEGNKSEMLAMIDNIRQKNPNISKEELKKIVSTSELKKSLSKLNESARRLNQELDITRQKRKDLTKNDELLENAEMDLDLCKGALDIFFNGMKLRQEYIKKFVKESYVEEPPMYETAYQEGFLSKKPKKLKPIPRDIIAYITVEMNDISSANDQAMLSGYTCSKLELVDFYLTVLDTQDPRYIVPHTKQYLETMKQELERLLTQILRIRPINRSDKIWRMNVTYPEGWRG